jgi:hypothetical protein
MFVSCRFEYHMFYVLYPFVTYLLPLLRTFKAHVFITLLLEADNTLLLARGWNVLAFAVLSPISYLMGPN